jgi:hypothetical protein
MWDRSVAAEVISSGAAITYDIPHLPPAYHDPAVAQLKVIVEPCGNTQIVRRIPHHRGGCLITGAWPLLDQGAGERSANAGARTYAPHIRDIETIDGELRLGDA